MVRRKGLILALFGLLFGAGLLRAAPVVTIELPAGPVYVGDSFSLTVRARGPIETFEFLLDLPASFVTPPGEMTLSAYPEAGGPPSEAQTLAVDDKSDFGFYYIAEANDYQLYLPLVPVGTGLYLGIVPSPPLSEETSEVTFTGSFVATGQGDAVFRLGFMGTLSPDEEFSGTTQALLEILQRSSGGGPGDGPGDGSGGGSDDGPVAVSAPPALTLFLIALVGLAVSRWSVS